MDPISPYKYSPLALPSNGAESEWSEHVVQVGGKTADKGAVFTVSNGQLPGERGSGGWAFQPLFHHGEDSIRIHRSFAILGQTFVGEEEPKGALLNNFTNEDKQVGSFWSRIWTVNYRIFLYSYMESKTCVCMYRERKSKWKICSGKCWHWRGQYHKHSGRLPNKSVLFIIVHVIIMGKKEFSQT